MNYLESKNIIKKHKVLIVEDNEQLCKDFTEMFNLIFEIQTCNSAEKAIELIERFDPDIIILDLILSGELDGLSLLRFLKSDSKYKIIPVIILSGMDLEEQILLSLELGACDYMIKPQSFSVIRHKINSLLSIKTGIIEKTILNRNILTANQFNDFEGEIIKRFSLMINDIIENDLHVSIYELAKKLNVSISFLQKVVKKYYGISPKSYLLKIRLEKANNLLQTKNIPIKNIAFSLGFNSTAYFTKCYRMMYGVPPKITKNQYQNN